MLHEIKNAKKYDEGIRIRWFSDDFFDLVIWYDDDSNIISFQLTYDKYNDPHALTWKLGKGYVHETIDDGETPGRYKQSPILLPDGDFSRDAISEKFKEHTIKGEPELSDFISGTISSLDKDDGDTGSSKMYPVFLELAFTQTEKKRLLQFAETLFIPKSTGDITTVKNEYELQQQIQYMTSRIKLSEERFNILCTLIIDAYHKEMLNAKEDLSIINKTADSGETYLSTSNVRTDKTQQLVQEIKETIQLLKTQPLKTSIDSIKHDKIKPESVQTEVKKKLKSEKKVYPAKKEGPKKNKKPSIKNLEAIFKKVAALDNKVHNKTDKRKQKSDKDHASDRNETISAEQLEKVRLLAKKLRGKR